MGIRCDNNTDEWDQSLVYAFKQAMMDDDNDTATRCSNNTTQLYRTSLERH